MLKHLALTLVCLTVVSASLSYNNGGKEWPGVCGKGKRQSPIDISGSTNASDKDPLDAAMFVHDNFAGANAAKINDVSVNTEAHSLKYSFETPLSGNNLLCPQFHFHFVQSEHTVNHKHALGEFHVVCHQNKYADLSAALASKAGDALAVFGFFIEENKTASTNVAIEKIINDKLSYKAGKPASDVTIPVPEGALQDVYWRYEGSLTTPTCNEQVIWTVFKTPALISSKQAKIIKSWKKGKLTGNNRSVQDLNGREISQYGSAGVLSFGMLVLFVLGL